MKIHQFCPFHNENLIANIQIREASKWIDNIHITEATKTFQYNDKTLNFILPENKIVNYHILDGKKFFRKKSIFNKIRGLKSGAWYNESVQRNEACNYKEMVEDNDIVILSDIDEILDSRYADMIVETVKKKQIVTTKLYFSLFYFNLFSKSWGGAPDYSYRLFIMTGKYFKNLKLTSDQLRKAGEASKLINDIYCFENPLGFHHSWIGDEEYISNKLSSYAHTEHNTLNNIEYIKDCLKNKKSIFPGHELFVDDQKPFLSSIIELKDNELKSFFVETM